MKKIGFAILPLLMLLICAASASNDRYILVPALRRDPLYHRISLENRLQCEVYKHFHSQYNTDQIQLIENACGFQNNKIYIIRMKDDPYLRPYVMKAMQLRLAINGPQRWMLDGNMAADHEFRVHNHISGVEGFVKLIEAFGANSERLMIAGDVDEDNNGTPTRDTQFIVMERVEGQELHRVLNDKRLQNAGVVSPKFLLGALIQTVVVMDRGARQRRFFHNDVHPDNLLFDRSLDVEKCVLDTHSRLLKGMLAKFRPRKNFDKDLNNYNTGSVEYSLPDGTLILIPLSWTCGARLSLIDYGLSSVLPADFSSTAVQEDGDTDEMAIKGLGNRFEGSSDFSKAANANIMFFLLTFFADVPCGLFRKWRTTPRLRNSAAYKTILRILEAAKLPAPEKQCRPWWMGANNRRWISKKFPRALPWRHYQRLSDHPLLFTDLLAVYKENFVQ